MAVLYTDPFGPPWKLPWLRMMTQWNGSIFQSLWIEFLVAMTACTLILLVWFMALKDSNDGISSEQRDVLEAFGYVTGRLQAAISLMLGFYTNTLYHRWWNIRTVESVVRAGIDDLSVQVAALVRDEPMGQTEPPARSNVPSLVGKSSMMPASIIEDDAGRNGTSAGDVNTVTASEVRMNLVRWLNLAHALAVGDLYGKKPNEFTSLESIMAFGLLTESEYEYLKENPLSLLYQAPFVWFLNLAEDLKESRRCGINDTTLLVFCQNVTKIRSALAELYNCKAVPVPLSYRQLVNWTVRSYMIMFAVAGGLQGTLSVEDTSGGLSPHSFLLLLPFAFEYFMFVGWLSLADALGNPFREWTDGFEFESYVKWAFLSSNLNISKTRKASPSFQDLSSMSPSIRENEAATLLRWSHPAATEALPLRVKLTGF